MGKSNFVEAEEASPPRHPALALESVCIFYMQSVQKGVKERRGEERREKNSEPTAKVGEGATRLVVRKRLEGARETEGNRKAKVLETRVIENFVIERGGGRRYLYNVPRIIFEAEILEARDTSYVTTRIALLKTHLHLNGNYPVWLEQRDRPI